ncbi:MAG TPA: hypothetical protein VHA70_13280 [Bauldia sp.]|nr:hypothetical protein [Bauldia sp.]
MTIHPAIVAVFVLAASAGVAHAGDPRLAAFRSLCAGNPGNTSDAVAAAAEADGWTLVTPDDDSNLRTLVDQTVEDGDTVITYSKTLSNGEAFLLDKSYDDGAGGYFHTCGIYDFYGKKVAGREELEAWVGKPNAKHSNVSQEGAWLYYDPSKDVGGAWRVSLLYNPIYGSMEAIDGFAGLAFVSEFAPPDFKLYLDGQ